MSAPVICCVGEVMLELGEQSPGQYCQGYAGDSFNTAVYLARAGLPVSFLSSLGDDLYSDAIVAFMAEQGIDGSCVKRVPGARPGLYLIHNEPNGERHFSYWRENSPVRSLFNDPMAPQTCDVLYFTGITLAVIRSGLENFLALLEQQRAGGTKIVFDPNFRPALWQSVEQAREMTKAVLPLCDIAMPTLDDETALWGFNNAEESWEHYRALGVTELVVKGAKLRAHVFSGNEHYSNIAAEVSAIDTTGAGDSFNAGYLGERLRGGSVEAAIVAAQQLAAKVVQHRGAILPENLKTAQEMD